MAKSKAPNGSGSVRRRDTTQGVRWDAQVSVREALTGRRRRLSKRGFLTQREALDWCADQRKKGSATSRGSSTKISDAVDMFLADGGMRASTAERYSYGLDQLRASKKRVRSLRADDFERIVREPGISISSSRVRLSAARRFTRWAMSRGMVDSSLLEALNSIEAHGAEGGDAHPTTPAEIAALLAVESECSLLWATFAATGIRMGEGLALSTDRIVSDRAFRVDRTTSGTGSPPRIGPPKNGRARMVGAPAGLVERLLDRPEGFVFSDDGEQPWPRSKVYRILARDCERAGIRRLTPHMFRHGWATAALTAGVHPRVVQEQLGHSSIAVTMDVYTRVAAADIVEAAAKVASAVGGIKTGITDATSTPAA